MVILRKKVPFTRERALKMQGFPCCCSLRGAPCLWGGKGVFNLANFLNVGVLHPEEAVPKADSRTNPSHHF